MNNEEDPFATPLTEESSSLIPNHGTDLCASVSKQYEFSNQPSNPNPNALSDNNTLEVVLKKTLESPQRHRALHQKLLPLLNSEVDEEESLAENEKSFPFSLPQEGSEPNINFCRPIIDQTNKNNNVKNNTTKEKYIDITPYLLMPQKDVARILGIPQSSFR